MLRHLLWHIGVLMIPAAVHGQMIEAGKQSKIIDKVAREMRSGYVFPEMGRAVANSLLVRRARGSYAVPMAPRDFPKAMTAEVSGAPARPAHVASAPQRTGSRVWRGPHRPPRRLIDSLRLMEGIGYWPIRIFKALTILWTNSFPQ